MAIITADEGCYYANQLGHLTGFSENNSSRLKYIKIYDSGYHLRLLHHFGIYVFYRTGSSGERRMS